MKTASRIVQRFLKPLSFVTVFSCAFLGSAYAAMDTVQQQQAFEQGWQAMKKNDLDKAYQIWDQLSKNPSNSAEIKRAVENNLAVVLMRQKKYQAAQQRLDAALQADKQVARTLDNLNQIYAYQAQQAYKKVFGKTQVKEPQGELLFIDIPETQVAVAPAPQTPKQSATTPPAAEQPLSNALFEVSGLVEGWRQAWSSQDVDRYLSFYNSKLFKPKNGMSYSAWEKSRYRNLRNPKYIKLYLDDVKLTQISDNQVRVDFEQRYESDRFKDTIHKYLIWQKDHGDWMIAEEEVVYANQL